MLVLRIEHKIAGYDGWKKAFDNDPIGRQQSGVRRYRVLRPADDPNYVVIDLEFDSLQEAETALASLRKLWAQVEGKVMFDPQTRIYDIAETKEY